MKMFPNLSISSICKITIFIFLIASNSSVAYPQSDHTDAVDLDHLKTLPPAGTYPEYSAAALVAATGTGGGGGESDNGSGGIVKRSWQNLQGAWGKRSIGYNDLDNGADNSLMSISKEDEFNDNLPDYEDLLKYSEIYGNGYRMPVNRLYLRDDLNPLILSGINENKRAWKNMNAAWGKRRTNDWNKFRGSWGKREQSWNNLKGLWGKRSAGDWNKLQSAWGKRSTTNAASTSANDMSSN